MSRIVAGKRIVNDGAMAADVVDIDDDDGLNCAG